MSDATQLFVGKDLSRAYAQLRPAPSPLFVGKILGFLEEKLPPPHELCLDIGCGTGLSTRAFAGHFARAIGVDPSLSQLVEARKEQSHKNVVYFEGTSSHFPVDDESTDLIVAVTAVHWFNQDEFFAECHRVLRPNGVIALGCYGFETLHCPTSPESDAGINAAFQKVMDVIKNGGYWPKQIESLENRYRDIQLPYPGPGNQKRCTEDPELDFHQETTVGDLPLRLGTTSGYRNYLRANPGSTLLEELKEGFVWAVTVHPLEQSWGEG